MRYQQIACFVVIATEAKQNGGKKRNLRRAITVGEQSAPKHKPLPPSPPLPAPGIFGPSINLMNNERLSTLSNKNHSTQIKSQSVLGHTLQPDNAPSDNRCKRPH